MTTPQGSWQPDPFGRNQYRWFDGTTWTDQVSNDSVVTVDPPDPSGAPAPGSAPDAAPAAAGEPTSAMAPVAATGPADQTPPTATASSGGGGGGGNKVPLIIGAVAVIALLGAGAFVLLGGDDDGISGSERAALIEEITADGWSDQEAGCLLDALVDELGADEVRALSQDNTPDAEFDSEQSAAVFAAYDTCGLDLFGPGGDGASGETDDGASGETDDGDSADAGEGDSADAGDGDSGDSTDAGDSGDSGGSDDGASGGDSGAALGDTDLPDGFAELLTDGLLAGGELTEEQAQCFAEALTSLDGFDLEGAGDDPDAFAQALENDPTFFFSLFGALTECGLPLDGVGDLGGGFDGGPDTYGDDPALDALWDACEAGDGEACDDLYLRTPIGSAYEEFGATCGGRFGFLEVDCSSEL